MIKTLFVFGTRPEAIKMAPLIQKAREYPELHGYVCVTGQHREMLNQTLQTLGIQPDFDLNIMQPNQTLTSITVRVLEGISKVIADIKPDLVLVHGDTTTSFAAALAAFYQQIPVGHVEAGLRTHNKLSPYPEEMNRQLTARIADLHFSPTPQNVSNLQQENIASGIYITGNTGIDALLSVVREDYVFRSPFLCSLSFEGKRIILLTAHRRENLGQPLENIFRAIVQIVNRNPDVEVVYPIHKNPAIRATASELLQGNERIHVIEPLDADDLQNLMQRCELILTDSGGIQEEAPALGKPVLVLRTDTERPEAVAAGTAMLVGIETETIVRETERLMNNQEVYKKMSAARNPYGDGKAAERICEAILKYFRSINNH